MNVLRLWPLRVLWILVPFTIGSVLDDALAHRVASLRVGGTIAFWALWAITLVASLVPRVETLTFVRIAMPAAVPVALWITAVAGVSLTSVAGIVVALAVAFVVLLATVGEDFVNGSSYGDEHRMPLRPPAAMLAGPIPLAWACCVAGTCAGPLLLLAHVWIVGVIVTAVGGPVAVIAVRALHQLTRRWVVFVPAGFVLHDHLALREPVLFARGDIVSLGPALQGTAARDLTAGAAGLALQVDFAVPVEMVPSSANNDAVELVGITQFLFMASRPGHVLAAAEARRLPVEKA